MMDLSCAVSMLPYTTVVNFKNMCPNVEFGDLVRKYLSLRTECDLFHGENHIEMHALDPEICLCESTCFIHDYTPLILTTCLVMLYWLVRITLF